MSHVNVSAFIHQLVFRRTTKKGRPACGQVAILVYLDRVAAYIRQVFAGLLAKV